jgi:hypothetical protein
VNTPFGRPLTRVNYAVRAAKAIRADPYEGVERTVERLAEWRDEHRPAWPYETTEPCEAHLHRGIGEEWPCHEAGSFEEVWRVAMDELDARQLRVGRGAFGGWDDADIRLARLAWCLARHLRPRYVVETGVARGIVTRVVLEAFERNQRGRLWSIDLPPLLEPRLSGETAVAVPDTFRERWTLLRGSSRRLLPGLVAGLGHVDLFVHDSMHTTRNVRFELERVWPALDPHGVVLVDDVEKNRAFGEFLRDHPEAWGACCPSDDQRVLIGWAVKRSR